MASSDATSSSAPSKFSLSLGTKKSSSLKPAKSPHKRPQASSSISLGAADDEQGEDAETHEQISSFGKGVGNNSAEPAPKKEQRVIPSIPDRDWQEESRRKRQKSTHPANPTVNGNASENNIDVDTVGGSVPKYGLNIVDRSQPATDLDSADPEPNGAPSADKEAAPPQPQSADEEALAALLGQRQYQQQTIIAPPSPPPSEDQVFRNSYAAAPRNCTLDEYEATPVEGYGEAILRGYLKAGQTLESQTAQRVGGEGAKGKPGWIPERRPGLLGLGAKESGLGVELGAWGKGAGRNRGSKPDEAAYNPLARRNKKTGELITEDELKQKVQNQGRIVLDDKYSARTDGAARDSHSDRDGANGSKRMHEQSSSRRRDRRYDQEAEEDSDRQRRRRKERERDRDRDKNKERRHEDDDYDRDRRRRDKHRERESDSDRKNRHTSGRDKDEVDSDRRHHRRDRSRERRKDRDYHSSRRE